MKRALFFLLAGVLLAGCSGAATSPNAMFTPTVVPTNTSLPPTSTPAPLFTQIYAFGDDFSDTGNGNKAYKAAFDQGHIEAWIIKNIDTAYWEGRASNGPLAVEILADRLNADLTNYAVWGAESGECPEGDVEVLNDGCLLQQIDKFEAELSGGKADPKALYYIVIGTGDFFWKWEEGGFLFGDVVPNLADQVVDNIITAVTRLAKLGRSALWLEICSIWVTTLFSMM